MTNISQEKINWLKSEHFSKLPRPATWMGYGRDSFFSDEYLEETPLETIKAQYYRGNPKPEDE